MTLKQLEAFYWAATCLNFSVAAQRLHLSISSLSKRITELEGSLGQSLFDRTGHKAALTGAGERLVPRARDLLQAADALRADIGTAPSGLHGVCRFGVGELTALTWLPRLVAAIRQAHPGLALEPHVNLGEVLEQRVESGELDFAVVAGRSSRSSIASLPIAQARFTWCTASAQALPGPVTAFSARLLQAMPLVGLPPGSGITRLVDDWLREQGAVPGQRISCNHWGAVAGMLAEGVGVGVLPQGWAQSLSRRGVLRTLDSRPPLPALAYSCQWRRDDSRPLVAVLRALTQQVADFSQTSGIL
jgi:DNA-binding transcriptional LysR family regulator